MTNKYATGNLGARNTACSEYIDMMESLTTQRCLETFKLDPDRWGVNVQVYSGSPANFTVYSALLGPSGRLMALDLPHGGHLSHGF
eukprot:CAMPEP_0201282458 /NCGR_PEP_ID=MMETSP1317-20130820/5687_1 /ASSEMBLY_ACC=CAM_ASM_000770 /TAXON_ID=187299 /ORGANISM="Undescribed Undescribed, Strain Undescribed" /LENGTH=85 /DNA_ID=CAMNT_0047595157 /DNA_START=169 /DNA_END=426 /DNA_ORIENTATION=+